MIVASLAVMSVDLGSEFMKVAIVKVNFLPFILPVDHRLDAFCSPLVALEL